MPGLGQQQEEPFGKLETICCPTGEQRGAGPRQGRDHDERPVCSNHSSLQVKQELGDQIHLLRATTKPRNPHTPHISTHRHAHINIIINPWEPQEEKLGQEPRPLPASKTKVSHGSDVTGLAVCPELSPRPDAPPRAQVLRRHGGGKAKRGCKSKPPSQRPSFPLGMCISVQIFSLSRWSTARSKVLGWSCFWETDHTGSQAPGPQHPTDLSTQALQDKQLPCRLNSLLPQLGSVTGG